jgi:hypothetical protein
MELYIIMSDNYTIEDIKIFDDKYKAIEYLHSLFIRDKKYYMSKNYRIEVFRKNVLDMFIMANEQIE